MVVATVSSFLSHVSAGPYAMATILARCHFGVHRCAFYVFIAIHHRTSLIRFLADRPGRRRPERPRLYCVATTVI